MKTKFNQERAELMQDMADISIIVGALPFRELREYGLQVRGKDIVALKAAMEALQFTLVGLQPKNRWHWRADDRVPFDLCVDGRLEGKLIANGLQREDDYRPMARRLRDSVAAADVTSRNAELPHHGSTASSLSAIVRKGVTSTPNHSFAQFLKAASTPQTDITKEVFVSKTPDFCGTTLSANDLGHIFDYFDLDLGGTLNPLELEDMLDAVDEPIISDNGRPLKQDLDEKERQGNSPQPTTAELENSGHTPQTLSLIAVTV